MPKNKYQLFTGDLLQKEYKLSLKYIQITLVTILFLQKINISWILGAGVQWSTLTQGASVDDSFSLAHVMMMLVIDTVLYGFFTWYIEAVFPGEYGVPLPWYFPFTVSSYFISWTSIVCHVPLVCMLSVVA
jgi:hypothetical protein